MKSTTKSKPPLSFGHLPFKKVERILKNLSLRGVYDVAVSVRYSDIKRIINNIGTDVI
jgi:hypothetical protein